jgi:hypothetical protein
MQSIDHEREGRERDFHGAGCALFTCFLARNTHGYHDKKVDMRSKMDCCDAYMTQK